MSSFLATNCSYLKNKVQSECVVNTYRGVHVKQCLFSIVKLAVDRCDVVMNWAVGFSSTGAHCNNGRTNWGCDLD